MYARTFRKSLASIRVRSYPNQLSRPWPSYSSKASEIAIRPSDENELLNLLNHRITATGPIPVPVYIDLCLNHPKYGYYSRLDRPNQTDPFGVKGDFITSPEVSQIFGELLAIWFLSRWQAAGCPSSIRIIELGPGRGTLMADVLRTFKSIKTCQTNVKSIHLIENSPLMRNLQRNKLSTIVGSESQIHWHDRIEGVPKDTEDWTIIIAHEFFDALPVHIFQKTEKGFREVLVDLDRPITTHLTLPDLSQPIIRPLRFVLSPTPTLASQTLISDQHTRLQIGSKLEISPLSIHISTQLAELLQASNLGGAGLIIDYGDTHHFGDSLRGFYHHQIVDPLTRPGSTDITTNVNFSSLQEAIDPFCSTYGPITQREFLLKMGIEVRTANLTTDPTRHRDACDRLISPIGMGQEYKVLGIERLRNRIDGDQVYPFV